MDHRSSTSTTSVTSLSAYRQALSRIPKLSPEDERALARRYRAGDPRAGDKLIGACLPFVIMIAREYRCWGVALDDLVQQGNLGLLKAAARFDPDRECRLVTYASYWVRAEIREHVMRNYRMVRLGTTKGERRALRAYRRTHETDPERLAALSGLRPEAAEKLLPLLLGHDMSADQPNAYGVVPLDRLASSDPTPEDRVIDGETRHRILAEITAFLREIPPRERSILRQRHLSGEPVTLERLGQRFGISKERVRQLEERTIGKLRARLLASFGLAEAS